MLSSCQSGTWICTTNLCKKTCSVYGIGHYETFDGHAYSLKGENSYVLIEVSYDIFFKFKVDVPSILDLILKWC